jgi:hypothetical protein
MNYKDFLAFYFHVGVCDNLVSSEDPEVGSGRFLTPNQFSAVASLFDLRRGEIEEWLTAHPRDRMYFDDYCYSAPMPDKENMEARRLIDEFLKTNFPNDYRTQG